MAQVTLGGNPTNTSGDLPGTGADTPSFTLTRDDLSEVGLSDYEGKKIIFNIFPSVDTGVCAASIRRFNKEAASMEDTIVLCISADLPFAQKRFCGAEGVENVETLSTFRDGGAFGDSFGTTLIDGGFKGLQARAVVVTDANGKVTYTELVPEIGQEPNYEAALAALK
jgi:thiol peroxidase